MNMTQWMLVLLLAAGVAVAQEQKTVTTPETKAEAKTEQTTGEKAEAKTGTTAEQKTEAAAKAEADEDAEDNLAITADTCEMDTEKHLVTLDGNVLAVTSDMQLSAKKMLVHLDADNKPSNIEAFDNVMVRVLKTQESATGDKAYYDAVKDVVTLVGNVVLTKEKYTATGPKAIYDRKNGSFKLASAIISIPFSKKSGSPLDDIKGGNKTEEPKTEKNETGN